MIGKKRKKRAISKEEFEAIEAIAAQYRMPWERLPGETGKAFLAFQAYRDLGGDRTMAAAAKAVRRNIKSLYVLSSKYNWRKRIEAWDAHVDRQQQKEAAKQVGKMRERHAQLALLMLDKAVKRLAIMDPDLMQDAIAIKLVEVATKLEARARGEPEEIQQHDHTIGEPKVVQTITIGGKKIEF